MKALIAMSGGVDSSVAARLTAELGHQCIGCTMKLYQSNEASARTCCTQEDAEDARGVAYRLGMPFYVFNFTEEFRRQVIDKFVRCYEAGQTPNPCIDCNRHLKFQKLYDRARLLGCEKLVTGHYARIQWDGSRYLLKKALDESKDQSYVLYAMTQEQLAHTPFPLGELKKSAVRRMAEEWGFANAQKPDSQDICFVPGGDHTAFLEQYTGKTYPAGNFITPNGIVPGRHRGIVRYTVGQRKGLGLSLPEPLYVGGINAAENTVTLCRESALYRAEATVEDFNWISGEPPQEAFRCTVRIRYRQPEQWATVTPVGDRMVQIRFDQPQRAITPGQAAVLYDSDTVLGGGTLT